MKFYKTKYAYIFIYPNNKNGKIKTITQKIKQYRVFQKFVPIVNCILREAFNASLGKSKLIQVRNLSK